MSKESKAIDDTKWQKEQAENYAKVNIQYHQKSSLFLSKHVKENLEFLRVINRQFRPSALEAYKVQDFTNDPLAEETFANASGRIIQKYENKILLLVNDSCPVYCRFCTRKRKTLSKNKNEFISPNILINFLKEHKEINEIIFSGGDPFLAPTSKLKSLIDAINNFDNINYIRFHTRTITTMPKMFDHKLINFLKKTKQASSKQMSIVLHINHSFEVTKDAIAIIEKLKEMGYFLYSQSVLLNGINNSAKTLIQLFNTLLSSGIQPYYLHQLDKIEGASHFYVEESQGIELMNEVRKNIPPYMMPRYVKDSPKGKINLFY